MVANVGHTPGLTQCGVAMAIDFIEHLTTDPKRCARDGRPPAVVGRPALRAAQVPLAPVRAARPVRRAVGVALATLADARQAAAYGAVDALRGGTYEVSPTRVRFVHARVVSDATADGTQELAGAETRTRLRLRGPGVPTARLTLVSSSSSTRVTGTVAGRHVALRFATPQ